MNRKRILSILLASVLTLPVPYTSVMAAEFTDGSASAQDAGLFSAGEGSEEAPYDEYIDGVQYLYNEESDSYIVDSVYNVTGETVYLKSEIHGRKVTEIALWIYRDCFEDVGEPVYLGEIVLPDTILKIDSGAFRDGQMTRLDIPDSVREIGSGAFNYCQNLRYLYFPAGTAVFPADLFDNCVSLSTIEIGEGVRKIESGAMKACPALTRIYIPETVTEIGEDLFDEGVSPTLYGVRGSYAEAYARAHGLDFSGEGETDPDQPEETMLLSGVYYTYQEETETYTVTGYDGDILSEISVPETINGVMVTEIGENAFQSCTRLKKIEFPVSIVKISDGAFEGCAVLEEITIKDGVKTIGERAFSNCRKLKSIVLPDSVETIGTRAFGHCVSLEELRLPSYMEELNAEVFYETYVKGSVKIPEGITVLKNASFNYSSFDELILPDTLAEIEERAFVIVGANRLVIPASVTRIEGDAFLGNDIGTFVVENGSYAESYLEEHGYSYDDGTEKIGTPKIKGTVFSGNSIRLALKSKCKNAQFYDYVITKDWFFPSSGNYEYRQNKSTALRQDFESMNQGTYYLYARAGRTENGKDVYGPWSERLTVTVSIKTPDSPKVQKVAINGSTVTVTVSQVADTRGYGIVLAANRTKNGCQKLLKPKNIRYASVGNKSTTYVFKNVKPGTYCVLTRSYTKEGNGKNVYSRWSGYYRKAQVKAAR